MFHSHVDKAVRLHAPEPAMGSLRSEVLTGLRRARKELPAKLFYDARGSQLFDQICNLDEYYLTRTETAITRGHAEEIASLIGAGCLLIEYGSGSSTKTRILLDRLRDPAAYVAIDISREHLLRSATDLAAAYPNLLVAPIVADYTAAFELPSIDRPVARRVAYFPGSTIGNFYPADVVGFLRRVAQTVGPVGALLIGVDLKKDAAKLHLAYNDRAGVTAAFNLNVLARINRELAADFRLDRFAHRAFYEERLGRIEMHLVSLADQTVRVDGEPIAFAAGESIMTEVSYKYTLEEFARLAAKAGFSVSRAWTDREHLFSVQYLTIGESAGLFRSRRRRPNVNARSGG